MADETKASNVIIVGGGIIGLFAALKLANAGLRITVLDDRRAGAASTVAAGMLAPLAECETSGPLLELCLKGLHRYSSFLQEIFPDSEHPEGLLFTRGLIRVARSDEEEEQLAGIYGWQKSTNLPLEWLTGDEARKLQPGLSETVQAAMFSKAEMSVYSSIIHETARITAERHPGITLLDQSALSWESCQAGVSVQMRDHALDADYCVLAAGSWTPQIAEPARLTTNDVYPVKGQIVTIEQSKQQRLDYAVFTKGCYLVPRPDNTIAIGATMEPEAGFDPQVRDSISRDLLRSANGLFPSIDTETADYKGFAGLRPLSGSGYPFIGPIQRFPNVLLATGHGRKGILLAPVTADLIAGHITGSAALNPVA